ncbi:hypothetical protein RND81_12G062900 [Saponaria officinalis]|uniref:Uncharacterized protein n=1 Tax=Saponaria officinalis TaxID=3572 RepID=A0AAW1H3U2_SAPOF
MKRKRGHKNKKTKKEATNSEEVISESPINNNTENDDDNDTSSSDEEIDENPKVEAPAVESKTKVYGLELVGATVKVWWPFDKEFYQGVVGSFDPAIKKYKILYDGGEIEILNLKKEEWQLINLSEGRANDVDGPDEVADETYVLTSLFFVKPLIVIVVSLFHLPLRSDILPPFQILSYQFVLVVRQNVEH